MNDFKSFTKVQEEIKEDSAENNAMVSFIK